MLNASAGCHPWPQTHVDAPAVELHVYQGVYVPIFPAASYPYTVFNNLVDFLKLVRYE